MTLSVGPARSGTDASLLLLRLLVPKPAKSVDYQTPQYGSTLRIPTALKVGADKATNCSNTLWRHVSSAAPNHFLCTRKFLWKSLTLQLNLHARLVATTKIFTKVLQCTRSHLSLRHVAATSFTATCRLMCTAVLTHRSCILRKKEKLIEYTKEHSMYCAI